MKYFIDTEIYSQGMKQPPRRVPVYDLEISGGKTHCNDRFGNQYTLNAGEIFEDGLNEDTFTIEQHSGSLWVSEAGKFNAYRRHEDGRFELLAELSYAATENPGLLKSELEAHGFSEPL